MTTTSVENAPSPGDQKLDQRNDPGSLGTVTCQPQLVLSRGWPSDNRNSSNTVSNAGKRERERTIYMQGRERTIYMQGRERERGLYICREEREREREDYVYIYIFTTGIDICKSSSCNASVSSSPSELVKDRGRPNGGTHQMHKHVTQTIHTYITLP